MKLRKRISRKPEKAKGKAAPAASHETAFAMPGAQMQKRLVAMLCAIALLMVALIGQLFNLQIVQAEDLQNKAARQSTRTQTIMPKRGSILDRNGQTLATSASSFTIEVTPKLVVGDDALLLARVLAEQLELDEARVRQLVTDTSKGTQVIKRQVKQETATELREKLAAVVADIKARTKADSSIARAVGYAEDSRRYYPNREMLEQVLGFCTVSSEGQTGIEKAFDKYLAGTPGSVRRETDTSGRELPYNKDQYIEPIPGNTLKLTVDANIQLLAEKAMQECLDVNMAKKVSMLMTDVKTGAILAEVNLPSFDLNEPPRNDMTELNALTRNTLISDLYDPGSTFKIVTTAAAIDDGKVDESSHFTCTGSIVVEGDRIRCWRTGNPHGTQTLVETLENSCNPAFVEMGLRIGKEKYYNYLDLFGFGRKTGLELSGEASGIVRPIKYVKDLDLARIAFGQSISVTPLQLIMACSAAVNGGKLMKPYIVSEILDSEGNVIQQTQPEVVSEPISEAASAKLRPLLEAVVESGSGRNAYVPGYRIGGKTGTAQKFADGKLIKDAHVSSFIGFAPMDDPQVAILVIVDESGIRPDYGSTVAAPFAGKVLQQVLPYLKITPIYKEGEEAPVDNVVLVPSVTGKDETTAQQIMEEAGLRVMFSGQSGLITEQSPAPGTKVTAQSIVMLYRAVPDDELVESNTSGVELPDLYGKSVLEANRILRSLGLSMRIEGSGLAYTQQPAVGKLVAPGSTVLVKFRPPEGAEVPTEEGEVVDVFSETDMDGEDGGAQATPGEATPQPDGGDEGTMD